MIDTNVHHTYLIKVRFFIETEKGEELRVCIFTSNHDCTSERFDTWAKERVKLVPGFKRFDEQIYSQHNITRDNFCE